MFHVAFTGIVRAQPEVTPQQSGQPEAVTMQVVLRTRTAGLNRYAIADVRTTKYTREATRRLRRGSRVLITGRGFPSMVRDLGGQAVGTISVVADAWEELAPAPDANSTTMARASGDAAASPTTRARGGGQSGSAPMRPTAAALPRRSSARNARRG
jgi:hypothetical protein